MRTDIIQSSRVIILWFAAVSGGSWASDQTGATEEQIVDTTEDIGDPDNKCSLPPVMGRCRANIQRFYYSADSADCLEFTYGGCGANSNNFRTYDQCINVCVNNITLDSSRDVEEDFTLLDLDNEINRSETEKEVTFLHHQTRSSFDGFDSDPRVGTVLSLDQNVNSSLDFEDENLSWSMTGFIVVNITELNQDLELGNSTYDNGLNSAVLDEEKNGSISTVVSLANNSHFEIEFSLFTSVKNSSDLKFHVFLEPNDSMPKTIFSLNPNLNNGQWRRYRFAVEPEEDLPDVKVVFHAETSFGSYIVIDNIFLSWKNIVNIKPSSLQPTNTTVASSSTEILFSPTVSSSANASLSASSSSAVTSSTESVSTASVSSAATSDSLEDDQNDETEINNDDDDFNIVVDLEKMSKHGNGTMIVHNEFHIQQSRNFSINIQVP